MYSFEKSLYLWVLLLGTVPCLLLLDVLVVLESSSEEALVLFAVILEATTNEEVAVILEVDHDVSVPEPAVEGIWHVD